MFLLPSSPPGRSPLAGSSARLSLLAWLMAALFLSSAVVHAQVAGAMDVWPANAKVEVGTSQQFGAYVPISPNTIVWEVNGIVGGNAAFGTITPAGVYQAPATAPTPQVVTVTARSTAYPTSFASTPLSIIRKYPWLWSGRPSSVPVGNYQIAFNGANLTPDSVLLANGQPIQTIYSSPTRLTGKGTAAAAGKIQFAVALPGPGAVTGNVVNVTVTGAAVAVAVTPATAGIPEGGTLALSATVTGSANTAVTWSVNGVAGGSAAAGFITAGGVYTAPVPAPSPQTVTIRATSVASPAAYGQSVVTVAKPAPPVTVAVTPATATVQAGTSKAFTATVTGSANTAVTWSVNGVAGGSAAVGTITSAGVYTAPAAVPNPSTVTVRATSVVNALSFAQSTVTVTPPPPPVTVAVAPGAVGVITGASQTFTATVTGSANTAVTWSVNGVAGGSAAVGLITSAGVYTAPAAVPNPATVTVRATSVAAPSSFAQSTATISAPPVPVAWLDGARFLEQSSFGPKPSTLQAVQTYGIEAYLDQQLAMPVVPIPAGAQASMTALRQWQLHHYTAASDQLRQRVAYALGQIVVTSGSKLVNANEIVPWLQLLDQHAFGNYRDLLRDLTRSPSMGKYLDLANSNKPGAGAGANENYPRELMQLFTIGLWELNQDGSQKLDVGGAPIPTYNQTTVAQLALALTGWTYATAPGNTPQNNNWEYFGAPMESRQGNHDLSAKSFLGWTLPANQTVEQDLDGVLDCLMQHPNIAPFIATRLIRSLVTSNPSGPYVSRVAAKFVDNGAGVRGDLKAVLKAILLDPEARQDVATATHGRLKDPILHMTGLLRALNGQFNAGQQLTYLFDNLGQSVLNPPSVFNWYSPLYRVPKSALFGPEFQIHSPTESTLRGNFVYYIVSGQGGGDVTIDLSPFQPYGNDMPGLVEAVNQRLLHGRMSPAMKQVLITAATPGYDAKTRIETVLYLTAISGQYCVQH